MNRRGADRTGPLGGAGMVGLWGASSLIKSIQRGTTTTSGATTGTVTVNQVDMNNSMLLYGGNAGTDTNVNLPEGKQRIDLTNSTTVTGSRNSTSGSATYCPFDLIEFRPGVIKSIQRGSVAITSTNTDVTITAVDMSKSVCLFHGQSVNGVFVWTAAQGELQAALTSATNVRFTIYNAGTSATGSWEVVEFF